MNQHLTRLVGAILADAKALLDTAISLLPVEDDE